MAAACKSAQSSSEGGGTAYSGISLNLIGEEYCEIELLRQLLQAGEELVEFLEISFREKTQDCVADLLSLGKFSSTRVILSYRPQLE
jgi:hypothetical protein